MIVQTDLHSDHIADAGIVLAAAKGDFKLAMRISELIEEADEAPAWVGSVGQALELVERFTKIATQELE